MKSGKLGNKQIYEDFDDKRLNMIAFVRKNSLKLVKKLSLYTISLKSTTLSSFRANQSLLVLLDTSSFDRTVA